MYDTSLIFYLVDCEENIAKAIRAITSLPGFSHTFLESRAPEADLAARADAILAGCPSDCLAKLIESKKPDSEAVALSGAGHGIAPALLDRLTDIWNLPMAGDMLKFHFTRLLEQIKRRKDLGEKSQFLETLLATSPNLVWFKKKDGVHELVNNSFCKTVNKTRGQVQGRTHAYIWDVEQDDPACVESERIVMESGQTHTSEEHITTGEGDRLLITYKSPLRDGDGSMMGTMGIGIDVTRERQYRQRLIENNAALENLFTTMDCGILCHTLDGKHVVSANQAALRILGYPDLRSLEGNFDHMVADSVLEEDKPKLRAAVESLKNLGDRSSYEYRVRHGAGEVLHIMGNAKLMEKDGELLCQRFLLDCTVQKHAEEREKQERERRQMELVRALCVDYQLVYVLSADGSSSILQLRGQPDPRLKEIFGANAPLAEKLAQYVHKCVHPEDQQACLKNLSFETLREKLAAKKIYYHNYRALSEGESHYFQMKAARAGNTNSEYDIVVGLQSVDARMRHEMEQREILNGALKDATRANRAKTVFLSNMSHDIRTPMNAVLGYASLALNHAGEQGIVSGYLRKIMDSGSHLVSLINDILDMSHIESGKIKLDEKLWDLNTLLSDLWSIVKPAADARGHTLTLEKLERSEKVYCDKLRFNQVLLNLLSNSIKYTPEGGHVSMNARRLGCPEQGRAAYEIRVRDNGIGMTGEFLERIFEPFERARSTATAGIQGTGLGMAITKNLVDMMGGDIDVRSQINEGTEFILRLNFRLDEAARDCAPAETGVPGAEEAASGGAGRRILLAEDNEMNQEIASEFLTDAGYLVEIAGNGQEALELVRASTPGYYDLILMDVQMPILNGYEATGLIRALPDPALAEIPILAMTANSFEEDRREALKRGMNGHIAKPIDFQQLFKTMDTFLSKTARRR